MPPAPVIFPLAISPGVCYTPSLTGAISLSKHRAPGVRSAASADRSLNKKMEVARAFRGYVAVPF